MANLSNINNKFLVTTGGNVLIGQTSAIGTSKLQVTGGLDASNIGLGAEATAFGGGVPTIVFKGTTNNNRAGALRFKTLDGTDVAAMYVTNGADGYGTTLTAYAGSIKFQTVSLSAPKMTILTGGNVGIGTASPVHLLQVKSSYDDFITKIENDLGSEGGNGLWVDTRWNVANNVPFKVTSNSGNSPMMIIKGNGAVGIGITDPSARLEVKENLYVSHPNAEELTFRLDNYGTTGTDAGSVLRMFNQLGTTLVSINSRGGSSRDTYFNQGGNFGVGTTNPGAKLHVDNSAASLALHVSRDAGGAVTNAATIVSGAAVYINGNESGGSDALRIGSMDNGTGDYYIDVSNYAGTANYDLILQPFLGNVGIGTSSPEQKLHVEGRGIFDGGTSSDILQIRNDNGGGVFGMTSNLFALDLATSNAFRIRQGSVIPFYIKGDGNIGIGTTGADSKIQVEARNASNVIYAGFRVGYNATSNNYYDADTHHFRLGTGSSAGGNLMVGGGVYLGGTAAANLLDDYEEGTFTATMLNDGVGNTVTANYTKIGRLVTFTIYYSNVAHTSAGYARISGFPFTVIYGTTGGYPQGSITHSTSILNASGGYLATTTWYATLNNSTSQATWAVGTGKALMVSGFYYTS